MRCAVRRGAEFFEAKVSRPWMIPTRFSAGVDATTYKSVAKFSIDAVTEVLIYRVTERTQAIAESST